ncbi:MAG: hypothetical protein PHE79_11175 [Eubacteriales bacterium]|nr:hypothetical protein [Eubacteriales bacterium]
MTAYSRKAIEDVLRDLTTKGLIHILKIQLVKKQEKHGKLTYDSTPINPTLTAKKAS